ncbi:hypothetical protein [Paracoccus cavernae]|uniref:hypothetical protein n=1 Tax=Paracoccus cavernae TaxID=1571207 RepID=UPI00362DBD2B
MNGIFTLGNQPFAQCHLGGKGIVDDQPIGLVDRDHPGKRRVLGSIHGANPKDF